jgi:DNA replication licensing factor MCM6
MPIRGQGLTNEDQPEDSTHRVIYVLHPNCALEEIEL